MDKKSHKTLKLFFTVTTDAFTMTSSVSAAFGNIQQPTEMEMLHRMALAELEKEEPNVALIGGLLFQMGQLSEQNKRGRKKKG